MEILKIFLVFSAVESAPGHLLTERSMKANDFLELVGTSSSAAASKRFGDFYGRLEVTYETGSFRKSFLHDSPAGGTSPQPITETFHKVRNNLIDMIKMFVDQSEKYVGRCLIKVCDLALLLLSFSDGGGGGGLREELRLPDDRAYCLITAMHDSRVNKHLLFEAIFFFRTIHSQDDRYSLKTVLTQYRDRFESHFEPPKYSYPSPSTSPQVLPPVEDIVRRLGQVQRQITSFSNKFCPWWKPLVNHGFLSRTAADDVRNESNFIRHVYFDETCTLLDGEILNENTTTRWWENYPLAVKPWILEWNCDKILKSPAYGYQRYKECISPKKAVERVFPDVLSDQPEKIRNSEFSLAALKEQLQSNNYSYLNVLTYYNVVSDVMSLASIKEGNKTIKGIALVVRWSCSDNNGNSKAAMDTIRGLRPTLFAFKSIFDEFVDRLEYEKRQDEERNNARIQLFVARIGSLMQSLEVRDNIQQSCGELETFLREELDCTNGDAYPADDPPSVVKCRWYYFEEPMLHVRQLYRFDAFGF